MHKAYNTIYLTIISLTRIITIIFAAKLKKNNVFVINNIIIIIYGLYVKSGIKGN